MRTVAERSTYWYNYSEFLCTSLLRKFCSCCCKNLTAYKQRLLKLERHEDAQDRLISEIDIVKIVHALRVAQFISKMILKRHQRALVASFSDY